MRGIWAASAAAALTLFAVAASPGPPAALRLSLSPTTIESGESVWVEVTLKNQGERDFTIEVPPSTHASADTIYKISVTGPGDQAAPRTRYGRGVPMGSYTALDLLPGQSFRSEAILTRTYDLTMPGVYTVSVAIALPGGQSLVSNSASVTVERDR